MSIGSFFGKNAKPPKPGEQIQYAGEDGVVDITGLTINGDPGVPEQLVGLNADGNLAWLTESGGGAVLTLSDVLTNGNNAPVSIDFADLTGVQSDGILVVNGDAGLEVNGSVGAVGEVLTSQGPGQPSSWALPLASGIQTDVNMNGNSLISLGGISADNGAVLNITAPDGIAFDGPTSFLTASPNIPEPLVGGQAASKTYVDTAISGAVGVNPADPAGYSWTGPQAFNGGLSLDSTAAPASVSIQMINPAAQGYYTINTQFTGAEYGIALLANNTWLYTGSGTSADPQALPAADATHLGQTITFINNASSSVDLYMSGKIMKFIGIGGTTDIISQVAMKRYASITFTCIDTGINGICWCGTFCNDDNSTWIP